MVNLNTRQQLRRNDDHGGGNRLMLAEGRAFGSLVHNLVHHFMPPGGLVCVGEIT